MRIKAKRFNWFIFEFNLLWTSAGFWDRTPENCKPREEAIYAIHRKHADQDVLDFATWYSGMDREKVKNAYRRYLNEINPNPNDTNQTT